MRYKENIVEEDKTKEIKINKIMNIINNEIKAWNINMPIKVCSLSYFKELYGCVNFEDDIYNAYLKHSNEKEENETIEEFVELFLNSSDAQKEMKMRIKSIVAAEIEEWNQKLPYNINTESFFQFAYGSKNIEGDIYRAYVKHINKEGNSETIEEFIALLIKSSKIQEMIKSNIRKSLIEKLNTWHQKFPIEINSESIFQETNSYIEMADRIYKEYIEDSNKVESKKNLEEFVDKFVKDFIIRISLDMVIDRFCKYDKKERFEQGLNEFVKLYVINKRSYNYLIKNCPMYIEFIDSMSDGYRSEFNKSRKLMSFYRGILKYPIWVLHISTCGLTAIPGLILMTISKISIKKIAKTPSFCIDLFFLKESHLFNSLKK